MTSYLSGRRRAVLVLSILTGLAAVAIDMCLPAIPAMVADLATELSTGQQIIGVFMAGLALGQLPAGLISDRIGRLPVMYAGIGIFTIAGAVCALTTSIETMLIGRFLQGMSASVGVVVSRAMVRDLTSGAEAARLLAIMVMVFTVIPMFAPLAGSFLVTQFDWRGPFVAVALVGALLLVGIRTELEETHVPAHRHRLVHQLVQSVREFFGHRQCVFGAFLVVTTAIGLMSMLTSSSSMVIEIYGYPVSSFGFIFALTGVSILVGSSINRRLLLRFHTISMIGFGTAMMGLAGVQLLLIAWLGQVAFWWLWGSICLYMFGLSFVFSNSTALALDPVPAIAGVAASLVGTLQNLGGATGAVLSGFIYDGTTWNVGLIMGSCGIATFIVFLLRPVIAGKIREPR